MYIQVRRLDNTGEEFFTVSKLLKIKELREMVEKKMNVPIEKQCLIYKGKQLEDGYKLFDYNIQLNDVIQLIVKNVWNRENDPKLNELKPCVPLKDVTETYIPDEDGISKYYRVGSLVDAKESVHGSWYEAQIKAILKNRDFVASDEVKIPPDDDGLIYVIQFLSTDDQDLYKLKLKDIRPMATEKESIGNLKPGRVVMANYNMDKPAIQGYWFDFVVKNVDTSKRNAVKVSGDLLVGFDSTAYSVTLASPEQIMKIKSHKLLNDADVGTEEVNVDTSKVTLRKVAPFCETCLDSQSVSKCADCGCVKCKGKNDPAKQIMCDECNLPYHLYCLDPPLEQVPEEDDWYCPDCKIDTSQVVKAGDKLKFGRKKLNAPSTKNKQVRDWGKGMACVGRTKQCTIVAQNHFGPVPGIEVGTNWKFRLQVSEAGVHRPPVAGIAGREEEGAFSIVLSGGYEDDVDNGDEFEYTGSGGRDLSGNKRTAEQSADQELTRMNKAIAICCNAKFNEDGAEAKDWQKGKPVRVVRNYKGRKHSKYAPEDGNRYDGIYKCIKYYKKKGKSGYYVWKFVFRRDDPTPAPWTKEGKSRIQELGLDEVIYPDGYFEAMAAKEAAKENVGADNDEKGASKGAKQSMKRPFSVKNNNSVIAAKQMRKEYKLDGEVSNFVEKDHLNVKAWNECKESVSNGKQKFLEKVEEKFMCVICQDLVFNPVTPPCLHNICADCLRRSFKAEVYYCAQCRFDLGKDYDKTMDINKTLSDALLLLFPGYGTGR